MPQFETEFAPIAAASATQLAVVLMQQNADLKLIPYRGALTPLRLDAAEPQTGADAENYALFAGAAVHDLGWLQRISVRGEDRFRWLSGMVTNTVEALPENGEIGSGAYNFVLNAQGRIQGDAHVWRRGDNLELEITREQSEALMAHFDRFIIMDDVELVELSEKTALGITGPDTDRILALLGLPALSETLSSVHGNVAGMDIELRRGYGTIVPHYALWVAREQIQELWHAIVAAGATPAGAAALEVLRVVEGIPVYGIDIQSRDLAQETSQIRALSFTKGCYLGQEIVERIRSRGQVHRHLRAVELMPETPGVSPTVGTELRIFNRSEDAKPMGTLTSVASLHLDGQDRIYGIAMVRAEAEVGSQPLAYAGGTVRILKTAPKLTTALVAAEENA